MHLEVLKRGVAAWNEWRDLNPTVWPNLLGTRLPGESLDGINLKGANLLGADLEGASLVGASLRNANLKDSILIRANLTQADLYETNLYNAKLQEAAMVRANLMYANLVRAHIERTRFSFARFGQTSFDHNLVLGGIDLDLVFHSGTSIVDVQIFDHAHRAARGNREIKEVIETFFQNAGVTERIIRAALEALSQIHEWHPCFISYSHSDLEFVDQLIARLTKVGVPCFWDREEIPLGTSRIIKKAARAIIKTDRTLLCCSWPALSSQWVQQEVDIATEKEETEGKTVLVPLDLDGCLLNNLYRPDAPPLAQKLRDRVIGDFRRWRDPDAFDRATADLIDALRTGTGLIGWA